MKCIKHGCEKEEPLFTVLIRMWAEGIEEPAIMYLRMPLCEEHKLTDSELGYLIRQNWEGILVGFDQNHLRRPVLEKSDFKWVPFDEYVQFAKQQRNASIAWKN